MMIKYTRTYLFKQINEGFPFIRPLFYDYPEDEKTFTLVDS